MAQEEALRLRDKLLSPHSKESFTLPGQQTLERLLSTRGIPSREELKSIHSQIDELAAKIDSLLEAEPPKET